MPYRVQPCKCGTSADVLAPDSEEVLYEIKIRDKEGAEHCYKTWARSLGTAKRCATQTVKEHVRVVSAELWIRKNSILTQVAVWARSSGWKEPNNDLIL